MAKIFDNYFLYVILIISGDRFSTDLRAQIKFAIYDKNYPRKQNFNQFQFFNRADPKYASKSINLMTYIKNFDSFFSEYL